MLWPNSWRENVTILANLINNNNEKGWNISLVFKGSQLLKRFFICCSLISWHKCTKNWCFSASDENDFQKSSSELQRDNFCSWLWKKKSLANCAVEFWASQLSFISHVYISVYICCLATTWSCSVYHQLHSPWLLPPGASAYVAPTCNKVLY